MTKLTWQDLFDLVPPEPPFGQLLADLMKSTAADEPTSGHCLWAIDKGEAEAWRLQQVAERLRYMVRTLDDITLADLTVRQRAVVECIGNGLPQKQAAASLGIAVGTLGKHVWFIAAKLYNPDRLPPTKLILAWLDVLSKAPPRTSSSHAL